MCNVVHAYLIEGIDEKGRDEFRVRLYSDPGLMEAVQRVNKAKGG